MMFSDLVNGDLFVNSQSKGSNYYKKQDGKIFEFYKLDDEEVEEEIPASILTHFATITSWQKIDQPRSV